jgi:hypothetical protein
MFISDKGFLSYYCTIERFIVGTHNCSGTWFPFQLSGIFEYEHFNGYSTDGILLQLITQYSIKFEDLGLDGMLMLTWICKK